MLTKTPESYMTLFLLIKGDTSLSIQTKENSLIFPLSWNSCNVLLAPNSCKHTDLLQYSLGSWKKSFTKSSQWLSLTSIAIHLSCLQNPTWALLIKQSPKHWQRKKHEQHPTQCFYILNKLYVINITCPVQPVRLLFSLQYKLIIIVMIMKKNWR